MAYYESNKLRQKGYIVVQNSPWHWSIRRKDRPGIQVEVWPTVQKILKKYSPGPAPKYRGSLFDAVEKEFGPVELDEEPITPERQQAIDLLDYYKENYQTLFRNTELFKEYLTAI